MGLIMKAYDDHAAVVGRSGRIRVAEIPETYRDLPVTEIEAGAFARDPYLEKVYLTEKITIIGSAAFAYCSALNQVGRKEDLEGPCRRVYMGDAAQLQYGDGCNTSVFPRELLLIGAEAFAGTRLEDVFFQGQWVSLDDRAFAFCRGLRKVLFRIGADLHLGVQCFKGSGVTLCCALSRDPVYLCTEAFADCFQLQTAWLRVHSMGCRVFAHCYNLRQLDLSDHLHSMLKDCFLQCCNLDSSPYLPLEKQEKDYTDRDWQDACPENE